MPMTCSPFQNMAPVPLGIKQKTRKIKPPTDRTYIQIGILQLKKIVICHVIKSMGKGS